MAVYSSRDLSEKKNPGKDSSLTRVNGEHVCMNSITASAGRANDIFAILKRNTGKDPRSAAGVIAVDQQPAVSITGTASLAAINDPVLGTFAGLPQVSFGNSAVSLQQNVPAPLLRFGGSESEDFETVGAFVNFLHMSYEQAAIFREQALADARAQADGDFRDAVVATQKDPMTDPTREGWALLTLFTNEVGYDASTQRATLLADPECAGMGRAGLQRWADSQYGPVFGHTATGVKCKQSVSEMWWAGMTQKTARIFRKKVFEPTNAPDDFHSDLFNTWHMTRRLMARPDESATLNDVRIFDEHLMYIAGGCRTTVDYIWDFLATIYQRPDEKIPVALAFVSPFRGTGKSMIGVAIKWVWGAALVREAGSKALWDNFDDDFTDCIFTIIEELKRKTTKVDSTDDLGKFNRLTSAVRTSLNPKGIPARVRRTPHLVITTNELESLPLAVDDRRLCPALCLDKPKDTAYYECLGAWIGKLAPGYGIPKLAGYLATRDVSGFKIDQRPPMTSAKQRLIEDNLSERATWLRSKIDAGLEPFGGDLTYTRELLDGMKMFKDDREYQRLEFTEKNLLPALRELREADAHLGRVNESATTPRYMVLCLRNVAKWRAERPKEWFDYMKTGVRPFEVTHPVGDDDE